MGKVADFFKWIEKEKKAPEPTARDLHDERMSDIIFPKPEATIVHGHSHPFAKHYMEHRSLLHHGSSTATDLKGIIDDLKARHRSAGSHIEREVIREKIEDLERKLVTAREASPPFEIPMSPDWEEHFDRFVESYKRSMRGRPAIDSLHFARSAFLEALTLCDKEEATMHPDEAIATDFLDELKEL